MGDTRLDALVDETTWVVDNEIVESPELYERELDRVFRRCWLYVGHESQVLTPGSYLTNYMGEDSVIVTRGNDGLVHVLLNKCRHRGNRLCMYDCGTSPYFKCSYHGWVFSAEGDLYSVPLMDEAYYNELDKSSLGLSRAKVGSYGGMIFASWDPAESLDDYLGEARFYLDRFLLAADPEGFEIVPGLHRYIMPGNWKLLSENFSGDLYHLATTHQSALLVGRPNERNIPPEARSIPNTFCVSTNYGPTGAAHEFVNLTIGDAAHRRDVKFAEELGPEVVEWVVERRQRINDGLADLPITPNGFTNGTIFPNLSLNGTGATFAGIALLQWHPRGPYETEVFEWCMVEKSAPEIAKETMVKILLSSQAMGGVFAPDDTENFDRISENTQTHVAKSVPFHYAMGIGHDKAADEQHRPELLAFPGLLAPAYAEANQRNFLRYWKRIMADEAPSATVGGRAVTREKGKRDKETKAKGQP